MSASRLEKFFWWCDRWLWWTVNGWFFEKAAALMSRRTKVIHDPSFIKATRVE